MTLRMRNSEEHEAIFRLFEKIMTAKPDDMRDSLAIDLMKPIYKKMETRRNAKFRNGWNLPVTEIQAKTYYAFFEGRNLGPGYVYEQIIIDRHLIAINEVYA